MKEAILKTLAYSDIFSFPLKKQEIWQKLVWQKKTKLDNLKLEKSLSLLRKSGKVKEKSGMFFLFQNEKTVSLRKKKETYSEKKFKKARMASFLLKAIPTIKAVCITGSLASLNCEKDDDIDFLIISRKGTLWLTRLSTTLLLSAFFLRRKPEDKNFKDKICLNIFLDEQVLLFPKKERNLFSANEIANTKLLWQRDNSFKKFKRRNLWVRDYLPNWKI